MRKKGVPVRCLNKVTSFREICILVNPDTVRFRVGWICAVFPFDRK